MPLPNWTERSLTDWLHELPVENCVDSCKTLLAFLNGLDSVESTAHQQSVFLDKIDAKLGMLVERIEKAYLDAGFPLTAEQEAKANLVTDTYSALSQRYLSIGRKLLAQPDTSGDSGKANALYLSLAALDSALLNVSMIYAQPPAGFWLNCYQLYRMAENAQLLDVAVTAKGRIGNTVNDAFKHILLFELSNTNQFRPRDMKTFYKLLVNHSSPAKIETDRQLQDSRQLCLFSLNRDKPPRLIFSVPQAIDSDDRFISTLPVAKNLYQFLQQIDTPNNALKAIHHSMFARAIRALGLPQRRKFNRNKERFSANCIVGFNPIFAFLNKGKHEDREDAGQNPVKEPVLAVNWKIPDFDLVPKDDDEFYHLEALIKQKNVVNANIIQVLKENRDLSFKTKTGHPPEIEKKMPNEAEPGGSIEIVDSSAQGFQILWKSEVCKVRVGEMIALTNENENKVQIGLIRRMSIKTRNEISLGVEMIGHDSEAVQLTRLNSPKQMFSAIFLPGIAALKQNDSVIFNTSEFMPGEYVNIGRGKDIVPCRLKKLLNSTVAITHIELYYTDSSLFKA